MEKNIIKKVRNFVEEECKKPTSCYGFEIFEFHLLSVVNYSKVLATKLGGNQEIVEIAAWLHDIGSVINGRKDHHLTGAKIAEEKLREFDYPEEKIEKVKKCILNHRGSIGNIFEFVEEQIVAEADALSAFNSISGLFKVALVYERLRQDEARVSVRNKLKNKWNQLSDESRELIKPKYEATMLLLGEDDKFN